MKKLILILFATTLVAITSCSNSTSSSSGSEIPTVVEAPKTPEELRMELKQQEEVEPVKYLSADGTYRENFWGDKIKVNCTITNKATLATFKDAVVEITYYAKSKTVLGKTTQTIYEIFSPNSTKTIELKIDNYKDVSTIGWDVTSATAVQ